MSENTKTFESLQAENAELRARLEKAEKALREIRGGESNVTEDEKKRIEFHQEVPSGHDNSRGLNIASDGHSKAASEDLTLPEQEKQEALRRHLRQLALITDTAPVFIANCDRLERFKFVNKRYAERFGLSPNDFIGKKISDILGVEAYESFRQYIEIVLSGKPVEFEVEVPYAKIGTRFMYCSYVPDFDENGDVSGWFSAITDITERKEAAEISERYRLLLEQARDVILFIRPDGKIVDANKAAAELYGYSHEELLQLSLSDLRAPETLSLLADQLNKANSGGVQFETMHRRKDGAVFPVEVSSCGANIGSERLLISIIRDIAERKFAEVFLRESEERYRTLFDSIDEGFCIVEIIFDAAGKPVDYRFLQSNPAFERYTGLENAVGKTARELVPELEEFWFETYGRVALTGKPVRFENKSEPMNRWFDVYAAPISDPSKRQVCIVFNNITERKRTEMALRESEERRRVAMDAARMYSWELDLDPNRLVVSENAGRVIGFQRNPFPTDFQNVINDLIHPDDREGTVKAIERALQTGAYERQMRLVNPETKETVWVEAQGRVWRDEGGKPVKLIGVTQNITQRKRREANLAFLAEISEDFSRLSAADEIIQTVGAKICSYLQVSSCLFSRIDEAHDRVTAEYTWREPDAPDLIGVYTLSEFVTEEFLQAARAGESIVICDTQIDERTDAESYASYNIQSFISVPFQRNGNWKYLFTVNSSHPRQWRSDEIEVVREVTNRIFPRLERARAEAALRESERQLQRMADAMPQVVWIADPDGRVTYYNRRVKDFARVAQNSDGTWSWQPLLHSQDLSSTSEAWQKAVAEKKPFAKEHRIMMSNGDFRWHLSRGFPVFDETGNISKWYGTATDIHDLKLAEEQVRYQLNLTQTITDNTQMCLLMMDSEGRGTFANPATERITGFQPEELIGEILHNKIHHTHPDGSPFPISDCPLDNALPLQESVVGYEDVFVHKDGHFYPVRCNGRPIFKNGKPIGTVIEVQDITEEKRAQRALIEAERKAAEEYQALLQRIVPLGETLGTVRDLKSIYWAIKRFVCDSMPCSAFFVSFYDAETNLRSAAFAWGENGGEVDVSELPPLKLSPDGGPNSQAVFERRSVVVNRYMDFMQSRKHVILQENGVDPQSSLVVPMSVMNRVTGTLEVQAYETNAFTEEHIVALEMAANLAAVAIENVRLIESESALRREAEEANRAKDEFLAVLSHELRTPLNAIYGWAQILEVSGYEREKTRLGVEIIARNVRLQNALIEDLLDASRIISGKMRLELETVSFVAIVQAAAEAARPTAEKQGIQIRTDLDPQGDELFGDKHRLQQVVGNLLTNAIKFTPAGGEVNVVLRSEADRARLSITDTGIGISKELLPHIFDRFRQADASSKRKYGGLGLGLTIVKHLVELHGGRIAAYSEGENQGATFTVELPLTPRKISHADLKIPETSENGADEKPFARARILVVDDDRDSLDLLRFILEQHGAEVVCRNTARKALEELQNNRFDLLISDLGMAEMDGYDLIRNVRESENGNARQLPAIALTGYVSADDRARVLAAGFQTHLSKPVNVDTLVAIARELTEKQ